MCRSLSRSSSAAFAPKRIAARSACPCAAARQANAWIEGGLDLSPGLVAIARELAAKEGKSEAIEFRTGDCRQLDIPDGSFDIVIAHTLISHVPNPIDVLQETTRLVKPGGKVVFFDGDYGSLSWSNKDPSKAKEYDEKIQSAIITNLRVMNDMPRLMRQAGLEVIDSYFYVLAEIGYVLAEIDQADFWAPALESVAFVAATMPLTQTTRLWLPQGQLHQNLP